ncbi:hypothetical protein [Pararhizobium qamdonense]|uniref:hypothetical protein n=1 Tax=Pararhizobium qamdonense TaxID=3031126 RepID=UPI0023E1A51D|nr:hypothetical protein [Pararhizobium qamdonense]
MTAAAHIFTQIAQDAVRHGEEGNEGPLECRLNITLLSGKTITGFELLKLHSDNHLAHGFIGAPEGQPREMWIVLSQISHVEVEWLQ